MKREGTWFIILWPLKLDLWRSSAEVSQILNCGRENEIDSSLKHKSFWVVLVCVFCFFIVSQAEGVTITVKADGSGDYPTIQAAIDGSNS